MPDRLAKARELGAEMVNFEEENPIEAIRELTGGVGPDRAIDVVGVDAFKPTKGPMKGRGRKARRDVRQAGQADRRAERRRPTPSTLPPATRRRCRSNGRCSRWPRPATLAIIGVYPQTHQFFPIGEAMNKNITMRMGNANHKKYVQELVELVRRGGLKPEHILTEDEPMTDVIAAYETFDRQETGWIKVELQPAA